MVKILHTADIHLDSPLKTLALRNADLATRIHSATRQAFSRIIDTAITEDVAALLIAGDLFDGAQRSARTAAFLTRELDRLRHANIRVFYIKGNHDAENPITGEMDLPENVHVFDGRGGKVQLNDQVWIHGVSFAGKHAPDSLLPKFPAPVAGAVNIAMLHTSLAGAAGHDTYAPCSVAELRNMGFDYWALGHVHKRQVHAMDPPIIMPGMPQGRDMGETGPKSATMLDITEAGITLSELPTSAVEFLRVSLDVSDMPTTDALRDGLRACLAGYAEDIASDAAVLRLTLTGNSPLHWQILRDHAVWSETVQHMAEDTGLLWLDRLDIALVSDLANSQGAVAELEALMHTIRAEPGFAQSCDALMEAVLKDLPAGRRATLLPNPDAQTELRQRLAATGAEAILARMKGADG